MHKKRTGKGFKISEEIVAKEEMYEEEDDDLPRHFYRPLASHFHSASDASYFQNQAAMNNLAHQQEIERQFDHWFRNPPQMPIQAPIQATPPAYGPPLPGNNNYPQRRPRSSQSLPHNYCPPAASHRAPTPLRRESLTNPSLSPGSYTFSGDEQRSPPALTPTSVSSEAASPHSPSSALQTQHYQTSTAPLAANLATLAPATSEPPYVTCATAEPPQETKLPATIDFNDPTIFFDPSNHVAVTTGTSTSSWLPFVPPVLDASSGCHMEGQQYLMPNGVYYPAGLQHLNHLAGPPAQGSRIGTPGGGEGDKWVDWVNPDEFPEDEPNAS